MESEVLVAGKGRPWATSAVKSTNGNGMGAISLFPPVLWSPLEFTAVMERSWQEAEHVCLRPGGFRMKPDSGRPEGLLSLRILTTAGHDKSTIV